jgi:hypothetical protein
MFVVIRKELKNNTITPVIVTGTKDAAQSKMLEEVLKKGKLGPNSTDEGLFFVENKELNIIQETKNTLVITQGYIYGETREVKSELTAEYTIMEIPKNIICDSNLENNKEIIESQLGELKEGDLVDACDYQNNWYPAKIISKHIAVNVSFSGYSEKFNELINIPSYKLAKLGSKTNGIYVESIDNSHVDNSHLNLQEGTIIDACDRFNKWYSAKIIRIEQKHALVEFDNWGSQHNEWIYILSPKFAKVGTFSTVH